jgi:SAM-dependent methyltransferase
MAEPEEPVGEMLAFDFDNAIEMARLIEQGRRSNETMGGPLAGLPVLPSGAQVIDLACGPGGWALDAAYERQDIEVAGVDTSRIMIDYANARAHTQKLTNASFGIMDITQPLDFADASFDLVNARALQGVLHRNAWEPFLAECFRVLKPGGTLRLTEGLDFGLTNSPALERMLAALSQMFWKLGFGFSVDGRSFGMIPPLPAFLRDAGYQEVRIAAFIIEFSAGMPAWVDFYHNYEVAFQRVKPLFASIGAMTEEAFDQDYHQMFIDMNLPTFRGVQTFASVIGTKPV